MTKKILPLLLVWGLIVFVWSGYRYFFRNPEWLEEIIFKPLVFIVPVIMFTHFRTRDSQVLLGTGKNWNLIFKWGVLFGLLLVGESLLIWFLKGKTIDIYKFSLPFVGLQLIISLSTAFSEEILYRGFLLERMDKIFKSHILNNIIVAVLFSAAHLMMGIAILNYRGQELVSYQWLMFILGFANGFIYQETRSTVASTITHTLWNFSNTFFII